jgi:hypothetical protein
MFTMEELKRSIEITGTTVECPVRGCRTKVSKIGKKDLISLDSYHGSAEKEKVGAVSQKLERYFCKEHRIYISPSTFIYENYGDNLLWYDEKDKKLLDKIFEVKRVKAQLYHDNSEDAVTWNVFRFLERNNLIEEFLSTVVGIPLKSSKVIYWSYSQKEKDTWSELEEAREKFGEEPQRSSEPDIIIKTDKALFFIEAKLTARNDTPPSDMSNSKKYETGSDNWFSKVFKSDYKTIAIVEKKYELLRFWLLGTWIAEQQDLDFYLVNLVLSEREKEIEAIFKKHLRENQKMKFVRITWENIFQQILDNGLSKTDKDTIIKYFINKTKGYDGNGRLQRAFSIPLTADKREVKDLPKLPCEQLLLSANR